MEKKKENELETGIIRGSVGIRLGTAPYPIRVYYRGHMKQRYTYIFIYI